MQYLPASVGRENNIIGYLYVIIYRRKSIIWKSEVGTDGEGPWPQMEVYRGDRVRPGPGVDLLCVMCM